MGWFIVKAHRLEFPNKDILKSLKIVSTFKNNVDLHEMLHFVAFHQGLYCLPKYMFRGF